jgi:parvulin-like peptidyl-prolyl isomerase
MSSITISKEDILDQIKISYKVPEVMEQIITRKIVEQEAERLGIKVETEELQEAADNFRKKNRLISVKITQKWLDIHQLSLDDFEQNIYLDLLSKKFKKVFFAEKVEKYFYQHQLDYDRIVMYEVVLNNKEIATELYYSIREGEIKFQDIASKYISDLDLRRKGGYMGEIERKDLKPALMSIFSGTTLPRIVKPISTARGFHLIWVEDVIKADLTAETYLDIQTQLFTEFLQQKAASIISGIRI